MSDTYQNWIDRVAVGRDAKPLIDGEVVKAAAGEPFGIIDFVRTVRAKYAAEVGKKSGDYVFHFYPLEDQPFPDGFEDKMGDAFLTVFRMSDRIEAGFSSELKSWAVRARGFADNPMADELALRVFDILDNNLE